MTSFSSIQEYDEQSISRPLADFPPSIWHSIIPSFSFTHSEMEYYSSQIQELKEEVKDVLMASTRDVVENLNFIDLLCRLGVSYHFESEIEEQLNLIFNGLISSNLLDYDLYTTSTLFRVLRQHGFKMPSDAFKKFMDKDGKFKKTIIDDVRGILSLYEASYLSVHGEEIMDEALDFTKEHLENSMATLQYSSPHLAQHIKDALILPFHKSLPRLKAKSFISFYQEDRDASSPNETLLKFAKLDYNRVQMLYQQELTLLSGWWKELNIIEKVPYARHRLVELYLWTVASHFEPQYALCRILLTKLETVTSILDDTFDAYGTPQELQLFADAFERLDIGAIDELPQYMKDIYKTLLNVIDEAVNVTNEERRAYCAYYVKEAFKELVRSYDQEVKWSNDRKIPAFDEYMRNGFCTSTYGVLPNISFIAMEGVGSEEFEWLRTNPNIARAAKTVARLENDIQSHEDEQKRGVCASAVECYMKENKVTEEEAMEKLVKMCGDAWKDANEECMKPTAMSVTCLSVLLGLLRATEVYYKNGDGYTKSEIMKDEITSLFVERINLD